MRRIATALASLAENADLSSIAPRRPVPPGSERPIPAELPPSSREDARRILLDGAFNFRDIGGYPALGGRRVRWGMVYRSDALSTLSSADLVFLERLGLRTVVDLRSVEERVAAPPPALSGAGRLELAMRVDSVNPALAKQRALAGELDREGSVRDMKAAYRQLVDEQTPGFGEWMGAVIDSERSPILVHCTAGKDRTGLAIAFLLRSLGVSMEDVTRDYLATNQYTRARRLRSMVKATLFSRFRTKAEDILPLLSVDAAYLEEAFGRVEERYGSFDAYLFDGLGLDEAGLDGLRERMLEPA